jgi:phosphatidylinositol 4-kinase
VIANAAPLFQYQNMEMRQDLCEQCLAGQGLLTHVMFMQACWRVAQHEREAIAQARTLCWQAVQRESSMCSAQLHQDMEQLPSTIIPDGEVGPTIDVGTGNTSKMTDEAEELSWTQVGEGDSESSTSRTPSPPDDGDSHPHQTLTGSWHKVSAQQQQQRQQPWVTLPPTQESTKALLETLLDLSRFGNLAQISPFLEDLQTQLLSGKIGVADFLTQLDEMAGVVPADSVTALKKQAFRVAGDMGTAMKLLMDYALPKKANYSLATLAHYGGTDSSACNGDDDLVMLTCILDFFLDLCEEGELNSVAFFWQQLCHIHLRMLPGRNAVELAKIDIFEDFLLTVVCHHSIHLGLELVWSHTADLEDSLSLPTGNSAVGNIVCSPPCRARRFSVLRFVCELESILFDYEDGWGGGSVSLRTMLSATAHQLDLLSLVMKDLQALRRNSPWQMTRSARNSLWSRRRANMDINCNPCDHDPSQAASHKLQVAKHAEYFSTHLNFTKRLCDVAEKLRFLEIDKRHAALEEELGMLNTSGTMGGDPLNALRENRTDNLVRVVRVPRTEGHVFRSKERTPILLLMEVIDGGAMIADEDQENQSSSPIVSVEEMPLDPIASESHAGSEYLEESAQAMEFPAEADLPDVPDGKIADEPQPQESKDEIASKFLSQSLNESDRAGLLSVEASDDSKRSPKPTALKRFGIAGNAAEVTLTPRQDVEDLVASVIVQQMNEVGLPDLNVAEVNSTATAEEFTKEAAIEPNLNANGDNYVTVESVKHNSANGNDPASDHRRVDGPESTLSSNAEKTSTLDDKPSPPTSSPLVNRRRSRMSALGKMQYGINRVDLSNTLAPTGDVRREVLNVIMMRGFQGNTIAAGTADSVQRSLQELERQRATELLLEKTEDLKHEDQVVDATHVELESTRQKLASLGLIALSPKSSDEEAMHCQPSEEDEAMESIRLHLIQNRVAQGQLSAADAAKVLQHASLNRTFSDRSPEKDFSSPRDLSETPTIDAGDVDPRLAGCGPLPPAVLQALTLWKGGMVTNGELLELVKKDIQFVRHSVLLDVANVDKLIENSDFWGRFAFGERWAEKKSRISATSPQGSLPGWDLVGVIVKSNDDLRQEAFVMQLIELCQEAFELAGLELWVNPYRILATGRTTGVIEMVRNAMSFDALKKRPGYGKGGLREHLHRMTEFTANPGGAFKSAQRNFVRSLAAYSLMSYLFMFKDRHNGNILLDTAGHVIHIDFGFVFGAAPGGSFSLEMSTPFKLTEEMLDVMGGLRSPLFSEFVTLFCCGFLALQCHSEIFLTVVEIMSKDSTFKCFEGRDTVEVVAKLKERFCTNLSKGETIAFALDLIKQATTSYGTRQYDLYQYMSQGIAV